MTLEHRYYGLSVPTTDLSTPNLQWLTVAQALEDLATFITWYAETQLQDTQTQVRSPSSFAHGFRYRHVTHARAVMRLMFACYRIILC